LNAITIFGRYFKTSGQQMQLSKLEIKGFKSFGDKVTINFDQGVTGIVGPNGCGKSNIVDAIRWVLGEQKTRALRSEKMENVIFNGTRTRKPTQLAEVSLTFINTKNILPTEYSTVTITRRYYRSGDSEYLLNGVACRLKDITNLFLDTGIGPDSYAIIELKMVDDILNDRENSRRSLFEEAAGISKFKIRKKETFKKLEETDGDLDRLEDVLFEIQKNIKTLEKQAKQAEQYFQLKQKYKEAGLQYAKAAIFHKGNNEQLWNDKIAELEKERASITASIAKDEAETEKLKSAVMSAEKTLSSRQKTLNEYIQKIRDFENEKKIKQERLNFFNEKKQRLLQNIATETQKINQIIPVIESLALLLDKEMMQINEREAELSHLRMEVDIKSVAQNESLSTLTTEKQKLQQLQEQFYTTQKSLDLANLQLKTLEDELQRMEDENKQQSESMTLFINKLVELSAAKKTQNELLAKLQEEELAFSQNAEQILLETEQVKEKLVEINRKLDARQNELNLTRSLVENMEGFPDAVKFLKKNKNWHRKPILVQDIITCEEKYKVAIETWLEPYLNYYIVQTEQEAYHAMRLLADNNKGRAGFFVLEKLNDFKAQKLKPLEDTVLAVDVVEFDEKYRHLVHYLLDGLHITTRTIPFMGAINVDTPMLFKDLEWNYAQANVVSHTGGMIQRSYALQGGSVGLFEGNRIGKARQLEKLEQQIQQLTEEAGALKKQLSNLQEAYNENKKQTRKPLIEQTHAALNRLAQEEVSIKTKQEQTQSLLASTSNRQKDLIEKIAENKQLIAKLEPQYTTLNNQLNSLTSFTATLEEQQKVQASQLAVAKEQLNNLNLLIVQKQNWIKIKQQEKSYKEEELSQCRSKIEADTKEIAQVESEITLLSEQAGNIDDTELLNMYEEKNNIESGLREAEKEYFSQKAAIEDQEKKIREATRRREQTDQLISEYKDQLNALKIELTAIKERFSVEFELNTGDLVPDGTEQQLNPDDLRLQMQKIKDQMERIGPVNPMAMEAYQEITDRAKFIEAQRNDLLEAKKSLLKTVGEIEQIAQDTFMSAFELIRENFQKVFRSLFTEEDTCDLVLADKDNPLESPIEIMARPKGKRPLTINQLSGGEKTLTAISLLFAIYLIKPAPFCIFDEVDAPLDDANIDKFNNIIRKFSKDSQFIIVTHNKRTMTSTDVIYGITMVEQGVSRVIPVDLREIA
jgi:chromosome segregation protein